MKYTEQQYENNKEMEGCLAALDKLVKIILFVKDAIEKTGSKWTLPANGIVFKWNT